MEYRSKCYQSFISKHLAYSHNLNKEAFDFFALKYRKQFLSFMPKNKLARIIDIACGSGQFLYFLQKECYTNTSGIDISEEQIAMATKIGVKNVWVDDLFLFLPKCCSEYDMIVATDIIEHFTKNEIIQFLEAIHVALKPQGGLLIATANAFSLFGAGAVFTDFTHEVGFTPTSLAQILRVCGFEDVEVHGEKAIAHDFRSAIRKMLWSFANRLLQAFLYVERGYGRVVVSEKKNYILEPRMFAVARKP